MSFIYYIIIGALAGFIAEKVLKTDMGLLMNLLLGIVGGFVGGFIFRFLGIGDIGGPLVGSLITATIGAILVLFGFNAIKKK